MLSKRIRSLLKEFSQRDLEALKSIYDFRCLSFNQIYERHYKYSKKTGGIVSDGYLKKKIRKFERLGIIEYEEDGKVDGVYFLTSDGVKVVKEALTYQTIYMILKKISPTRIFTLFRAK